MTEKMLSAYEHWTWERCGERVLSLKNRLGYGERIWVLGFEVLDDGRLLDPFHGVEVFDPSRAGAPKTIPSRYSAVPEMFCILSTYAEAEDIGLSGEQVSLAGLDSIWRAELPAEDCAALLKYAGRDYSALQAVEGRFFGAKVERGDLAFTVWPLPRAPVTLALWQGDEEMDDGGTLLFDRTVRHYVQDLVRELAWLTVWRLKNILDREVKWGYHGLAKGRGIGGKGKNRG